MEHIGAFDELDDLEMQSLEELLDESHKVFEYMRQAGHQAEAVGTFLMIMEGMLSRLDEKSRLIFMSALNDSVMGMGDKIYESWQEYFDKDVNER